MARRPSDENNPGIDTETIVRAALKVLNEDGIDNLTIRSVASLIGVRASALYWHISDKATLVDHMADAILRTQFSTIQVREPDQAWQEWLLATMLKLRAAMLSYRDGGRIVTGAHLYPAVTLTALLDASLASLSSDGIELERATIIISTAAHFTFGRVIEEQSGPTTNQMHELDIEATFKDFSYLLRSMKQTGLYDAEGDFIAGLELIIRGASIRV